jgi:hypothetical protein
MILVLDFRILSQNQRIHFKVWLNINEFLGLLNRTMILGFGRVKDFFIKDQEKELIYVMKRF